MRRIYSKATISMALALLCHTGTAAETPVNALWNDGTGFGIWIYGQPASCVKTGYMDSPVVIVGTGQKRAEVENGKYAASGLKVCMAFVNKSRDAAYCESGMIDIEYDAATAEYAGTYQLLFGDGKKRSGSFRAQYCKSK